MNAQAAWKAPLAGRENLLTLGAGLLGSRAHFQQSSQFGYLTPDRGILTVPGPGAFADGTQDSENAFDSRVDLTGKTTTYSAYISDSLALTSILELTVSGRYDHTRVKNDDAITPEDEDGH